MVKIPTYIIGTGGLGKGVLETIKMIDLRDRNWDLAGFIDDNIENSHVHVGGLPVVGDTDFLLTINDTSNVVIAIANPIVKEKIHKKLSTNSRLLFPNVIHPTVTLNPTVKVGYGNIISEHTAISADVEINNFTLVHFNSTIGHDIKIKDYATIYPGGNLSGFSILGEKSQIGSNACVLQNVKVGVSATVGAGALVNKDVCDNTTVAGVPAKLLRSEWVTT
ncbi:hypothetical protein D4T97_010915 [Siminovitchia acidinfaciens]|uniref:PglD N-terminal domain-containing protein n=1 Tax=Siminovitchia acidinfaciens TaxID=2321395 RepID=A0A429XZI1_9BACI|nr:NeuD/PglB/VioB family sugar acetyltransferase [Siminovitchia acidinfaciens]RST74182.1 hypothetical protein D4T97_010915 [Siminovitchia acidinfaciens]